MSASGRIRVAFGCAVLPVLLGILVPSSALGEPRLFIADNDYSLIWILDGTTGKVMDAYPAPHVGDSSRVGPLGDRSGLAYDGTDLYYTRGDVDTIWALDPATGAVRRELQKPRLDISALAADGTAVYAAAAAGSGRDGALYSLDPLDGTVLTEATLPSVGSALTAAGPRNSVFVTIGSLEIRELDSETGATLASLPAPEPLTALAYSASAEALYGVSAAGLIYKIDPSDGGVLEVVQPLDFVGDPMPVSSGLASDEAAAQLAPPPNGDGDGDGVAAGLPGEFLLEAQDVVGNVGQTIDVPILLTTNDEIEGLVIALVHDPEALFLEDITIEGTVTEQFEPDFVSPEIVMNGGALGVIFDLPPIEDKILPSGEDIVVARYLYGCVEADMEGESVSLVRFGDGVIGDPLKFNIVVVGGRSFSPELSSGQVTCRPRELSPDGPVFLCGGPPGVDGQPTPLEAGSGEEFEFCFYYAFPDTRGDLLQGVSMALAYDCRLDCLEETFRVPEDSITAMIDADFVEFHCDNNPNDGDGCEMILGILADSLPPFGNQSLPETTDPLLLACVDMQVGLGVDPDECLEIRFRDGLNGTGVVPVKNLVSLESRSFAVDLVPCEVCVSDVGPELYCGAATLDENGFPETPIGSPGDDVEMSFWFRSPGEPVLAMTQALAFDCNLECQEETFQTDLSTPGMQNLDFVEFDCDNDPNDGDGCEMVLTIVGDIPEDPGGGALLPTNVPRRLGSVTMTISETAPTGRCLVVEHVDGIDGTGGVDVSTSVTTPSGEQDPLVFDCQICVPADGPEFFCGGRTLGEDGLPVPLPRTPRGGSVELCFWYRSPVDEFSNEDEIQGFTMALCYDCSFFCNEESIRFPADSIIAQIEPEFINFHCDNDPLDGDGCEMILGVVVEATPPFEGRTLPPSDTPLLVGCMDVTVLPTAKPGFCLPIEFCDGVNGRFKVPVKNLVSVKNESLSPQTNDCEICVDFLGPKFICGGPELGPDNLPTVPLAIPGEAAELCFWYCSPEDGSSGHEQLDQLQGVSIAVDFDCALTCVEDSFRMPPDSISGGARRRVRQRPVRQRSDRRRWLRTGHRPPH